MLRTRQSRILVTGSRNWTDELAVSNGIQRALRALYSSEELRDDRFDFAAVTLVHGGAPGLDTVAERVAAGWNITVEKHTAEWHRYGRRAGPARNARMVLAGADICLAFPSGDSTGTRDCMRLAVAAGIPLLNLGDPAALEAVS